MPEQLFILTPSMRAQLRGLFDAGATSYGAARAAFAVHGFDRDLIELLRRFELIGVRKSPGATLALYHLTAAGVAEVHKPTEAAR